MIQTILDVARRFPVIRFDAAMVLAKKHVRRLWFPGPGEGGGAIPSRAEYGTMTQAEFDAAMPAEFWREVVDRVAAEAPDTLLLAEAFWLLEGYFVRTLGMHRVYNSAFMHMLRDEDNAGYRRVLKETLEFDPEILKRYVNFMNNPDEKTAVEQFGKGDKYFGVATLLATLPGLPMFGHGQFEGFAEKYGMEFRRATLDEQSTSGSSRATSARSSPSSTAAATSPRRATSCCTTSRTTAAASTSTCSPTRTAAGRRGRSSCTTTGTPRRRAGSGTPPPTRSRRATGRSGSCGGRWPMGWGSPTGRPTTAGSRSASSARRSSTCAPSPSSASAACTSRCTPTRRACSGRCASSTTRPASGAGSPSGSAAAACRRSRARSASSSWRRCTTRCGR